MFFKIPKRLFQDRGEAVQFCLWPLNMVNVACLFIEIYWSVGVGNRFKIVLEIIKLQFRKHLQQLLFLPYVFRKLQEGQLNGNPF